MTSVDNESENGWADDKQRYPAARSPTLWRALGTAAGVLGGEGLTSYLHPALGEILAAADIIIPLAIAVVLLASILCGSSQTCERVFRLLRWIANRPEPPVPGGQKS